MADQSLDGNFISSAIMQKLVKELDSVRRQELKLIRTNRNVTCDPWLTCRQSVKVDFRLQIRHRTCLILRNIIWKATDEALKTSIIGGRVLESLGCNNQEMLLAARDKFKSDIDVNQKLEEDNNQEKDEATIAAPHGESVFHRASQTEDERLKEEDVYVDLDHDTWKQSENDSRNGSKKQRKMVCPSTEQKRYER